jgi:hypothetical protein
MTLSAREVGYHHYQELRVIFRTPLSEGALTSSRS